MTIAGFPARSCGSHSTSHALEEQNESKQPKGGQTQDQADAPSQYQRLTQAAANADQQVEQSQNELQSLRQKLETAPEKKRPALESLIAETQSELALRQAHRDALHNMLQFATGASTSDMGAAGLRAQIEELARSVPAALSGADGTSPEQTTTEQTSAKTSPSGNREAALRDMGARRRLVAAVPQRTHAGSADPIDRSAHASCKAISWTPGGKPQKPDSERRSAREPTTLRRSRCPRATEKATGCTHGPVQAGLSRAVAAR